MHKKVKALAPQCCNHFDTDYCIYRDRRCLIKAGEPCKYFEDSVLPVDPALQELYFKYLQAQTHGDNLTRAEQKDILDKHFTKCEKCHKEFTPVNNFQKYCDRCKKSSENEKARLRMQKLRILKINESCYARERNTSTQKY